MSDQQGTEGTPGTKDVVEALLFASDEPLAVRQIIEIFGMLDEADRPKKVTPDTIIGLIDELNREYRSSGRAIHIVKVAGGFQFATLPKYASWLGRMLKEKSRRKLSISALESLAVIAYKQPVTKPEVEAIRGVNADYVLKTLLERNIIAIVGRAATPGRPLLYGTTKEFLKHFGLNDLSELPKPREIDELMEEAQFEVEKQLLKEQEAKSGSSEEDFGGDDSSNTTDGSIDDGPDEQS